MQLAAVLLAAAALRALFFVGYGLGDDNLYISFANRILEGGYPDLHVNQAAYRPLLLYMWAASIAMFGYTDIGVVAPVLLASIATVAIVYAFTRRFFGHGAAMLGAVLFAFQPFNVVNSTTMTNDVILSCLVFGAVTVFLVADADFSSKPTRGRFALGAVLMTSAYLVKITMLPALCALGLYSAVNLRRRAGAVLRGHLIFYVGFLIGLACICAGYYLKTGDPFWQFKSEIQYYEVNKPDWYIRGDIDYPFLMKQYPESLFGLSGYRSFKYFDHGLLMWLFAPAAVWALAKRQRVLSFLVVMALCVFLFFEFYPHYLTPYYLPLVRQTRYLEMLIPPVVIVVGVALHRLWERGRVLAIALLIVVLADFVFEASRRSFLLADSLNDMRALAGYISTTIKPTRRIVSVDGPANSSLQFLLWGGGVPLTSIEQKPPEDSYVVVGGARSAWWDHGLVFDVRPENVPTNWVLTYVVPGLRVPWRPTDLRVYYVGGTPPAYIDPVSSESPLCQRRGLQQTLYPAGFGAASAKTIDVERIPEIDAGTPLPAPHLEWTAGFQSEGGTYTIETTSDDGSWVYLNDRLVLDNGGTHPAKTTRTRVLLGRGMYRFKLHYEDTGGVRFLRIRVYQSLPDGRAVSTALPSFCADVAAPPDAAAARSIR